MVEEERARARREGIVALVVVQLCFGLFPLFVKRAFDDGQGFTPSAVATWRIAFGALVLLALAGVRHGRAALPARGDWPRLWACALLGVAANQALFLEGVRRSSVVNAGLFVTTIPVLTYAFAVLARQERLALGRALGILLGLAGALLLVLERPLEPALAHEHRLGNLLLVANCACYAWYLVLARALLARLPSLVLIAWVFACSLAAVPFLAGDEPLLPARSTPWVWGAMAYVLLCATLIAYLLNTFALARVSASTTAAFIYLQPLIAGASAVLFAGEEPSRAALVAALFLFGGITLVVLRR
jgi:drug/metabolite transporter (DMT)-like permease